jgi:plastocyanin
VARIAAILFASAGAMLLPLALSPAATAASRSKTYTVTMDKMKFGAVPAGLRVGDTIIWVNNDMFRHTATARDNSFNVDLPPGARGTTRLTRAGAIAFYCRYHPGMTGRLAIAR